MNRNGKVYLVGAGPGDPQLLTLRGRQLLEHADTVVYDALVGAGVLAWMPQQAEKIYVGKRDSRHTLPQEEISRLLVQKAREGRLVVRLKGGDPFLFGRGGEELALLAREGIPFEVVPGVSSALAVPAYAGIPVTHRDYSSSVHIITAHKKRGESSELDFKALARLHGTLVFLMGVAALGDICRGLLSAGMPKDTPAALLAQGTTAGQRTLCATLGTLEETVLREGATTPAIIVVGGVAGLCEDLSWREELPLFGLRILLTRPKERMSEAAARLRALGAEVLEQPTIRTERIAKNDALSKALTGMDYHELLVFTSPTGVHLFFASLKELRIDRRTLGDRSFAVIGPATAAALEEYGYYADYMPDRYDARHLGELLAGVSWYARPHLMICRAREGSPELLEALGDRFFVSDVPVYETKLVEHTLLSSLEADYVFFTSASTVRGYVHLAKGETHFEVRAICIGAQTAAVASSYGMQVYTAGEATMESMIKRLLEVVA